MGMYRHFALVHLEAEIIITEDGELKKCFWCGMRMAFPEKHGDSFTCRKVKDMNRNRRKLVRKKWSFKRNQQRRRKRQSL